MILLAVRWYLRYALSYRDVEELQAERGIDVDHVSVYRWVQRFVYLSNRRDIAAARVFFTSALAHQGEPAEVVTGRAAALGHVIDELLPGTVHNTGHYENNRVECDHGRLKARLRPMRGVKANGSARVMIAGHAFVQNLRRGHHELGTETPPAHRLSAAFAELQAAA